MRASRRRAGIGARREASRRTWRVLRRPSVWLLGVGGMALVTALVVALRHAEQLLFGVTFGPLATGVMLGVFIASVPWALWTMIVREDGSMTWRQGAEGERSTAAVLDRLGRDWRIEHSVPFPQDEGPTTDVDHVAIGPGGVLAIETKWTSRPLDLGAKRLPPEVDDAAKQALGGANCVGGLLRRVAEVEVIPVVVYWGPNVTAPPGGVRREGAVRIVAGADANQWLPRLRREGQDAETVVLLADRVRTWRAAKERDRIGATVDRRLRLGRRLEAAAWASAAFTAALVAGAHVWPRAARLLVVALDLGGSVLSAALVFSPLLLAVAAWVSAHLARAMDPTVSTTRGIAPLAGIILVLMAVLWLR